MLATLKHYSHRVLTAATAATVFLFMLPLTLGMMLLMLILSIFARASLKRHLQPAGDRQQHAGGKKPRDSKPGERPQKPPIEGTYTVLK
jgi:hypothetical protein